MGRVRSALDGHPVVVVMDNCEHLLPGVAELVAGLLAGNSGVRVVATSREPLDVAGERVWPVSPLEVPSASASLEEIERSPSGALFIARLPMNVATRSLGPNDAVAVAAVCRGLDGIPLGLELAAARSRTLSLPDLAERLEQIDQRVGVARSRRRAPPPHDAGRPRLGHPVPVPLGADRVAGDERVRRRLRAGCVCRCVRRRGQSAGATRCWTSSCARRSSRSTLPPSRLDTGCSSRCASTPPSSSTPPTGATNGNSVTCSTTSISPRRCTVLGNEPAQPILVAQLQREAGNFRVALDWAAAAHRAD